MVPTDGLERIGAPIKQKGKKVESEFKAGDLIFSGVPEDKVRAVAALYGGTFESLWAEEGLYLVTFPLGDPAELIMLRDTLLQFGYQVSVNSVMRLPSPIEDPDAVTTLRPPTISESRVR